MTVLKDGPLRYTQLHHAVSNNSTGVVHNKTLTDTLTYLREQDLVEHHHHEDDGADYRLTAGGEKLVDLLAEIERWSRQYRTSGSP